MKLIAKPSTIPDNCDNLRSKNSDCELGVEATVSDA
jgi:hypothetical protein